MEHEIFAGLFFDFSLKRLIHQSKETGSITNTLKLILFR